MTDETKAPPDRAASKLEDGDSRMQQQAKPGDHRPGEDVAVSRDSGVADEDPLSAHPS